MEVVLVGFVWLEIIMDGSLLGEIIWVGTVMDGNCPSQSCLGGNCHEWDFSEWELSMWQLSWVEIFPVGNSLGEY